MRPKTVIGVTFLAAFGFLVMRSFGAQVGGYATFAEAANMERRAHIIGYWEADRPTVYNPRTNVFSFWMRDEAGEVRQVHFHQPKPANFGEAEQVVIEGHMDGEAFTADRILIKCPSKYIDEQAFQEAHPAKPTPAAVGLY